MCEEEKGSKAFSNGNDNWPFPGPRAQCRGFARDECNAPSDRRSSPRAAVDVVKSPDFGDRRDFPQRRRFDRPRFGCVAVQPLMAPRRVIVILDEIVQDLEEMPLVEHDDVIQAGAA